MRTANPTKRHVTINVAQRCRNIAGVTLTELLIAMAIIGIMAGIAAPSFSDLMTKQRTKAVAADIYIALSKARSEAIKRNTSVTLSPKSGTTTWQAGWEIFNPTDAASRLEDHNPVSGITITGPTSVVYLNSGRVRGTTAPTFDISSSDSHACVTVSLSGLPTQKSSSC
jgi:type IV fimbrial biogenesis protein FimT